MADTFKKVMLALYDEKLASGRIQPFLLSMFGKNPQERVVAETDIVDIDVIRDSRKAAVDVVRGAGAGNKNVVGKFTAHEYKVPLYWEETPLTAGMLNKRIPGVDPYTASGKAEALAYWAVKAQLDNTNKIIRAMEKMAAEALQSGTITLVNGDSLNFGKKSHHTLTPSVKWDSTGNPITDIKTLADTIYHNGKIPPDTLIMGSSAFNAFINNAKTIAYLNTRYIEPGRLAPGEVLKGAKLWGRVGIDQYMFDIYVYADFYETTTQVPYLTTDTVICMNRNARLSLVFGAVEVLPQYNAEYAALGMPNLPEFVSGEFVPFAYNLPPAAVMAGVQSAPLVIPTAIDTIGTIINVDT